jgi:hypothetical protein
MMAEIPPYPGTPRWVKLSGIAAGVGAALVAVLLAAGGHGPGRHLSAGDAQELAPEERGPQ